MDEKNFAEENSTTNHEEVELNNTENEENLDQETMQEEHQEDQEEAELDSTENENEEAKPQKKRKSGVPKLLAEKNRQAETIKSMAEQIKAQEAEIKRLKSESTDSEELQDARVEKKLLEMQLAQKLAEEYPEVDAEDAKNYAKQEGLSITNAYKLLNLEITQKQSKATSKSLTGEHYDAGMPVYTQKDLAKMSQADYNKAIERIERGKARYH